jgi:hypothetical protein
VPGGSIATAAFNLASPSLKKGVLKQSHVPPGQRAPVHVSPQRGAPAAAQRPELAPRAPAPGAGPAAPPGGTQWLPYPYPLPYPVPGWGGTAEAPGVAWPPRG